MGFSEESGDAIDVKEGVEHDPGGVGGIDDGDEFTGGVLFGRFGRFEDLSEVVAVIVISHADGDGAMGGEWLEEFLELLVVIGFSFEASGITVEEGHVGGRIHDLLDDGLEVAGREEAAVGIFWILGDMGIGEEGEVVSGFR